MRIIITGGTGLLGRPLSAALAGEGHEVIVLTRNPDKVKDMPAGVQLHAWDAESMAGWGHLADGAFAIINYAGEGIGDGRWSAERKQKIRQSRTKAGKAVIEAIKAAAVRPKVLVQASGIDFYAAQEDDRAVTEASPVGSEFLAKVCFDWEASTAAAKALGVRRPILRTGIVLANEGGAFPKLLLPFKLFAGGPLGNGKQWLPWIHIADHVRAVQFLLQTEAADGPFNLVAPNPVTNAEMAKAIGEVMGRPAFVPAPAFALRTALGEMSALVLAGRKVVPTKLQALGFSYQYETLLPALRNLLDKSAAPHQTAQPQAKAGA